MTTEFPTLLPFVVMAGLVELTPGPNMAWLVLLSARDGRAAGAAAVVGIALGLSLIALAVVLGLSELADTFPIVFDLLRFAGVAYMLWLAVQTWQGASETSPARTGSRSALSASFRHGLTLNVLNPKAATLFAAVLPTFVMPDRPAAPQLVLLSAIYVLIATTVHVVIVLAAARARPWLEMPGRGMALGRVFAATIVAVAIWMLVSTGGRA